VTLLASIPATLEAACFSVSAVDETDADAEAEADADGDDEADPDAAGELAATEAVGDVVARFRRRRTRGWWRRR
jgi:hypothetical protein